MKTINFSRIDKAKFFRTLNKRVNTYFKENNINYISGDLNTKEIINEISISDVIFDLASPYSGTLFQTKQFYKDRLELVIKNMKKNTKFIFASSINAFGMSEHRRLFKD